MTTISYILQDWQELPADRDWLTPEERTRLDAFRFEKRRRDWLLGRWAAKIAVLRAAGLADKDIGRIEIATATDGAPLPLLDGRPGATLLSLSHSKGRAFAAASTDAKELGCDLELVEPRGHEFVETWFTESECEQVARSDPQFRDLLVTAIWSAKESTLKALRTGLRIDTRRVEVSAVGNRRVGDWNSIRTIVSDHGEFDCFWRFDEPFVLSVVTRGPAEILRAPGWDPGLLGTSTNCQSSAGLSL